MCRIFGFCGESSPQTTALLRALVLTEESGNPHGTGLLVKNKNGKVSLNKKGIRGRDFLVQGYADFLWTRKYSYALGHVRFKTKGPQCDENSHPFGYQVNEKWFWGIHNGIIGVPEEIAERYGIKEAAVDTATFFKALAKLQRQGKQAHVAIEELSSFISQKADFAFAYLTDDCLWLWRSPDRPLCIFDARPVGLGRWFASTKEMFAKAWIMSGIRADITKCTYFEAKPYSLYYVKADGIYEVEALKTLRHFIRERPRMSSSLSGHYPRPAHDSYTGSLFGEPFDPFGDPPEEDDEDIRIRKMDNDDLALEISKVETEIQTLK